MGTMRYTIRQSLPGEADAKARAREIRQAIKDVSAGPPLEPWLASGRAVVDAARAAEDWKVSGLGSWKEGGYASWEEYVEAQYGARQFPRLAEADRLRSIKALGLTRGGN